MWDLLVHTTADTYPTVSNQDDIDRMLAGCTSIEGDINIADNYTGSFFISNITSISGGIGNFNAVPLLTSIEVQDLTSIAAINIFNASILTTISFPDLFTVEDINIQGRHLLS